jgi:hypothetical protein
MQSDIQTAPTPKWMFWVGWVLTILPALALLASGSMKLIQPPGMEESIKKIGWDDTRLVFGLGIVEIACALIYLFPPTSVLGAILVTGYLGGAVATHVRIHDFPDMAAPIILGVLIWGGLFLRCGRVRALIPLRS